MGIMDMFKGRSIPPHAAFRLTQLGTEKLQGFNGDPRSRILMALETQGTSDVDEIAGIARLRKGQVEKYIPILLKGGYIQYVNSGMGGE
jgi:DNA-binding MarR family transcriptional regulator